MTHVTICLFLGSSGLFMAGLNLLFIACRRRTSQNNRDSFQP